MLRYVIVKLVTLVLVIQNVMRIFPIIDCIIINPNSIKITLTSSSFLSPSNMLSCVLLTTKNNKINRIVELVKYGKSGYLLHVMQIFPKMTASHQQ